MISDEYDPLEVIGKGLFGIVRKVRNRLDGLIFVRKEIDYTSMNPQERNQLISELRILRELNHPNIVKYCRHDHIIASKSIHIYMEYCDGGDLGEVISTFKSNKETVPEEFVWQVLVQTLLALHKCHYGIEAQNPDLFKTPLLSEPPINLDTVIIHRDIKPENIFMLNNGKTIKLGDFGLAKMLTSQNDFAKTYVGTPYYMSPEVLMDQPYSPVCDIWSLGCVLYELCTLSPPFQAKTHLQLQAKIKKGVIPDITGPYSEQLTSLIRECITVDPNQRPSCFDILQTLAVRFLRQEMELKDKEAYLTSLEAELKKKEAYIKGLEKRLEFQKKQTEKELIEEFEARKKLMDQEAKEVRLNYQREFRMVVEQEVQSRLGNSPTRKENLYYQDSPTRKENLYYQESASYQDPPMKPKGPKELIEDARRVPLKPRNDVEGYRKRITDELERLAIDKRNIPEYETYRRYHHR